MTVPLDPKFHKVVALMRSTQHEGERAAAKARAEAMAAAAGMSIEEAIEALNAPSAPTFVNILNGFDDFMEREEPGWQAELAGERAKRRERRLRERAEVLAQYGSEDAALAPCDREKMILDAVRPWRRTCAPPNDRWTETLDGWRVGIIDTGMPPHVRAAILQAYPMPETFPDAFAEHQHWERRDHEMDLACDPAGTSLGDDQRDFVVQVRAGVIRDLVLKVLPITNTRDLLQRLKLYRDLDFHDETIIEAVYRDLEKIVASAHPSKPSADQFANLAKCSKEEHPSNHMEQSRQSGDPNRTRPFAAAEGPQADPSTRDEQIRAVLNADPSRSDRAIARAIGCSPTTVGKTRLAMGLSDVERSVQRRGQMYSMRARAAGAPT